MVPMVGRLTEADRNEAVDVGRLFVPRRNGGLVRLDNVVRVTPAKTATRIDRLDRQRMNSIRAAVTGFAKTLANEVAEFGITVNNILPGYTATERVDELAQTLAAKEGTDPAGIRARWEAQIPMKRLGRTEEFAAFAAFLVSERASYITGSSVAVDGGWIRSLF